MCRRHSVILLAMLTGVFSASADRTVDTPGGFALSSSNLEHVQKDDKGREIAREIQHFSADGFLTGRSLWTHEFEQDRPTRTSST